MATFEFTGVDSFSPSDSGVRGGAFNLSGSDEFRMSEDYVRGGAFNLSGSDTLAFDDEGGRVRDFSAAQTFSMSDVGFQTFAEIIIDLFIMTQTGTAATSKVGTQTFTMADSGSAAGSIFNFSHTDTFNMTDGGIGISSASQVCNETYVISPALGNRSNFVLTWPYVSPSLTVTLRVPLFGNTDNSDTGTKIRRTASNQLSVARGDSWPVIRKLKFSFTGLSETQRDNFLSFITASTGFEIGILDQENRQWRGVIISPIETTQVGLGCDYSCGFEFQGRLA